MTTTVELGPDRSVLRIERVLRHCRERVWRAVTDPEELRRWFPSAVIYEPRVGAPMQFDFGGEHDLDVWPGEVLAWDPPNVFAFRWAEDELRFALADADDGATRLVFTHAFAHQAGREARDGAGWAACFDAFDALLAGAAEPAMGDWRAHERRFAGALGDLALEVDGDRRPLHLTGPNLEVDGRPAVAVEYDGNGGVLVVADADAALAEGARVDVRAGSVAEPGDVIAHGVLRDPLADAEPTTITVGQRVEGPST